MSFDNVIYEKGEVATLTLNRPDISNGFNIPTCQEILEVLDLVKTDDSVKILVIQAVGKVFSIGGDLAEMQRAVESDNVESLVEIASLVNKISFAMKKLPKPVSFTISPFSKVLAISSKNESTRSCAMALGIPNLLISLSAISARVNAIPKFLSKLS